MDKKVRKLQAIVVYREIKWATVVVVTNRAYLNLVIGIQKIEVRASIVVIDAL